jgi:hypothetical protein
MLCKEKAGLPKRKPIVERQVPVVSRRGEKLRKVTLNGHPENERRCNSNRENPQPEDEGKTWA